MKIQLSAEDARVIGALIEKEITTPDQYPLSLNALVNACNQKSNRDPVMNLDARTVQQTLDDLARRALAVDRSGFGSRVPKYRQLFCNTAFGSLRFSPAELAIVCELLLRGPQTPGELRTRASRMHPFRDVDEVQAVLDTLASREDGPFVVRLEREPGRRESRYAHLFSGPHAEAARDGGHTHVPTAGSSGATAAASAPAPAAGLEARVAGLEQQLAEMRLALDALQRKLGE